MTLKTTRVDIDTYFMLIAKVVSLRSTCCHREQGAVIVNNDNRIISTGYNGQPPGAPHCIDIGWCAKDKELPCRAEGLHAESNAVASAAKEGTSTDNTTVYCVYSPCMTCCNLLKSAGIKCVKYLELYPGFVDGPTYMDGIGIENRKVKYTEALGWTMKLG